jgi:hypothetical protein
VFLKCESIKWEEVEALSPALYRFPTFLSAQIYQTLQTEVMDLSFCGRVRLARRWSAKSGAAGAERFGERRKAG